MYITANGYNLVNRKILLIDDLYRSGSTLKVATNLLYNEAKESKGSDQLDRESKGSDQLDSNQRGQSKGSDQLDNNQNGFQNRT
jgi:hypoxanthine phosphoribosyltransferase